jgi:hypothetical protein
MWSYTSAPSYVFLGCCLVKDTDSFTFYLTSPVYKGGGDIMMLGNDRLFVVGLFSEFVSFLDYNMAPNYRVMENTKWKGCARKRLWIIFRFCPGEGKS